jgi:hypothetical protein
MRLSVKMIEGWHSWNTCWDILRKGFCRSTFKGRCAS